MDLFEYQGKQYFARFGIPVSPGGVADTVDEAVAQADAAGYPVVVKAQVQVGGRGKAGGIKLANDADEVRTHAGNILGMDIKGHVVERLWVEHASDIAEEYYASFTLDRAAKKHLRMLSAEGGVEIEEVAETDPDAIAKLHIDPVDGLDRRRRPALAAAAGLDPREARDGAADILVKLYRCFVEGDCDLVEINPLILTPDGEVHALDAKVTLDDNAAFRHPEWEEFAATEVLDDREQLAKEKGLQYIGLDGSGRHHRQRRRPGHEHARRRQPGRRHGRQLPRHRRRRQRRRDGGRARGHQLRRERAVDLHQHLRRHHPGRGGGQGHRRGARAGSTLRAPIVIRLDGTNAEEGREILADAGIPPTRLDREADHARRRPRGRRDRQRKEET